MRENTVISVTLDPRLPSYNRQNSKSPADSIQSTPAYVESPPFHPPTLNTSDKTTVVRDEISQVARKCPRLEFTHYKPVKEILKPKLYDDLIRYECIMEDGKKQSVNVINLRVQDIAEYEFSANRVGASVMYNKSYKLPVVDKVCLITSFQNADGKDIPYALLRYENDFHLLTSLQNACKQYAQMVEDYFKRTLFNSV